MKSVYTDEQLERMEIADPVKALYARYRVQGTPDPDSGMRLLSETDMAELMNDPAFRRHCELQRQMWRQDTKGKVDTITAVEGLHRAALRFIHWADSHARQQRRAIDMAIQKYKKKGRDLWDGLQRGY